MWLAFSTERKGKWPYRNLEGILTQPSQQNTTKKWQINLEYDNSSLADHTATIGANNQTIK